MQNTNRLAIRRLQSVDAPRMRELNNLFAQAFDDRESGVAMSLIGHLRLIAHERGAWVVFVQADPGDEPAIALYQKLGVREDVIHFDLPVP